MKRISLSQASEWGVLFVLAFSILWRGGKGLESTWLLALVAGVITLGYALKKILGIQTADPDAAAQSAGRKSEIPVALWGVMIFLILMTIVSYLLSDVRNYGLDSVLRTISFTLLFFWTVRTGFDGIQNRLLQRVVLVVTLCTILAAFIGILVYVLQPVNRFVGTFFDIRFDTDYWPNAWAEYVLIAWPLMRIQIMKTESKRLKMFLIIGFNIVIGTLLLSYSRGGWIAFALQIALLIAVFTFLSLRDIRYRRLRKIIRMTALIRGVITIVIAAAVFFGVNAIRSNFYPVQSVSEKVTFTADEGKSSINERSDFWKQSWELSLERPFFGHGPYSFRFVQPQIANGILETSDHAHNIILNSALERGWPTAMLSFLIFVSIVVGALHMLFMARREWSQEKDMTTIMLLVAVIGVYAHNMIDFNLQFVGISLPFWLCLGFLVTPVTSSAAVISSSFARWKWSRLLFRFKFVLACALLFVTVVEGYFLGVSSLGRHAEAAGDTDEALRWYRLASPEWFSRDMHLSAAGLYMRRGVPEEALASIDAYMKENMVDPRAWKMRGEALLRMRDFAGAKVALEKAYELGKYTDLNILELLLKTAEDSEAKKDLISRKLEFDALFSQYADAIELNTHFIALSRNVESLMSVSRELSELFPNDENRYKLIARSANSHAIAERAKLTTSSSGYLW